MTLEEAIKNNAELEIELDACGQERQAKGVRLGIEALEREQLFRQRLIEMKCAQDIELLPSEEEK